MTDFEFKQTISEIIYLCSCELNDRIPEQEYINSLNLDCLFEVSKKHMLSSLVGQVIIKAGVHNKHFIEAVSKAKSRAIIFENDYNIVLQSLENSGIWYMPLKGAILKNLYPSFAMREMCDIDILFDSSYACAVKELMEKIGFINKSFNKYSVDVYYKAPVSNFEMHKELFGDEHDIKFRNYYKNIKTKLLKSDNKEYRFDFSPEDFYIFLVSHEYKHYCNGGTGLRSLLDSYIYLNNNSLNMDYVINELDILGITDFERLNRSLSIKLFNNIVLTEEENEMFNYIIYSGAYGTFDQSIENKIHHYGGKAKYLSRRVFGPKKDDPARRYFEHKYSFFYNHPVFLPVLPFYRLINALKKHPSSIRAETKAIKTAKNPNK